MDLGGDDAPVPVPGGPRRRHARLHVPARQLRRQEGESNKEPWKSMSSTHKNGGHDRFGYGHADDAESVGPYVGVAGDGRRCSSCWPRMANAPIRAPGLYVDAEGHLSTARSRAARSPARSASRRCCRRDEGPKTLLIGRQANAAGRRSTRCPIPARPAPHCVLGAYRRGDPEKRQAAAGGRVRGRQERSAWKADNHRPCARRIAAQAPGGPHADSPRSRPRRRLACRSAALMVTAERGDLWHIPRRSKLIISRGATG